MDRREFVKNAGVAVITEPFLRQRGQAEQGAPKPERECQVAAYYFGNYHVDPRNEQAHGKGWTEWNIVKGATPRFPGHRQPRIPLWGYQDESDPAVFAKKVEAAADHGLTAFIFDWYWYNDGPFLERALENGFLQADNRNRMKFAVMWANHNWTDIHPAKLTAPPRLQFPGSVTTDTFRRITDHLIERYFTQPNYWLLDGCPYFSLYELGRFVEGFGSVGTAAEQIAGFRERVKSAGFPDLHFNAVVWGEQILPGQTKVADLKVLLQKLQVDSVGSYVWIHHTRFRDFPVVAYDDIAAQYAEYRTGAAERYGKPYFPNVTVGWDASPRTCQTDVFTSSDYPFTPVIQGNSPERFGNYLREAKASLDSSGLHTKVITVNSWNEWTEGSYLEPDTEHRFGYLEQIAKVFGGVRR